MTGQGADGRLERAAAFVAAVVARDEERLVATLADDVRLRALTPGGVREATGADAAAGVVLGWFAAAGTVDLLDSSTALVGQRVAWRYRLRVEERGEPLDVEQACVASTAGDRFGALDLLCSGFQPRAAVAHRFDAGSLGCGNGLPRAFRERMAAVPVGDRLEVVVADPAAKADLPALARLMGHQVVVAEGLADGRTRIVVERGR